MSAYKAMDYIEGVMDSLNIQNYEIEDAGINIVVTLSCGKQLKLSRPYGANTIYGKVVEFVK